MRHSLWVALMCPLVTTLSSSSSSCSSSSKPMKCTGGAAAPNPNTCVVVLLSICLWDASSQACLPQLSGSSCCLSRKIKKKKTDSARSLSQVMSLLPVLTEVIWEEGGGGTAISRWVSDDWVPLIPLSPSLSDLLPICLAVRRLIEETWMCLGSEHRSVQEGVAARPEAAHSAAV